MMIYLLIYYSHVILSLSKPTFLSRFANSDDADETADDLLEEPFGPSSISIDDRTMDGREFLLEILSFFIDSATVVDVGTVVDTTGRGVVVVDVVVLVVDDEPKGVVGLILSNK